MPSFSSTLEAAIHNALGHANERKHELATLEHLLLALLDEPDAARVMKACGVDLDKLRKTVIAFLDEELDALISDIEGSEAAPTTGFQRVIQRAAIHVQSSGRSEVTGANVLVAIFAERESHAAYFLQEQDMTRYDAVNYISHGVAKDPSYGEPRPVKGAESPQETRAQQGQTGGKEAEETALQKYCVDLNEKSRRGSVDPLIGRDLEVERCIQVLCRRRKNNPLLVGDPGVGKTAIAEGLAKKIVDGDTPDVLADTTIFALDMGALLAGTRNPRNPAHTPGGSSSGSAAAVAAGMLPISFGSQTGGSVIRPAAYCGVAGYKPSFRLIPTVGIKVFSWSLDTVGVFGAGVADVAFAAAATTGRDLRVDGAAPDAPRIALVRTHQWSEASSYMQAAVERAARVAEAAGARVTELALPAIFEDAIRCHGIIQDHEAYRALAYEYDRHRARLGSILTEQLGNAANITTDQYDEARRTARRARQTFADLMATTDVILTPSAPEAAPHGLGSTGKPIFNRLWTLLGPPCINVPGLTDGHGLPLGVQIVGRFARDKVALTAARHLEAALARAA
jgi:hypothetical protein